MNFIAAKDESRLREQGKTTSFYNGDIKISSQRIETFKRRARQNVDRTGSPTAETPRNITYHTPLPEDNDNPFRTEQYPKDGNITQSHTPNATLQVASTSPKSHHPLPSVTELDFRSSDSPPPLNTECTILVDGMRGVALEKSQKLAQEHKAAGNLAEAASEYLLIVEALTSANGSNSLVVLEALSQLADIYQTQRKLPESISIYRRVVAGYQQIFGLLALETIRKVQSLAKVLEDSGKHEEGGILLLTSDHWVRKTR